MTRIISFSELFTWDSCERQYFYAYELNIRPQQMSNPMSLGTKGHRFLQYFYEALASGDSKEVALKRTQEIAADTIKESTIQLADVGTLLRSWMLVDNYIRDNEFPRESVLVENRFLIAASNFTADPHFADVQIGFTPDVVFKRGNFYDVEDAKFVGRAWSQKKLNRFMQAKLYQIFLRQMGYNVTRTTLRFFNTTTGKITRKDYVLGIDEETILIRDFIKAVREALEFRDYTEMGKSQARRTMNYSTCQYCFYEEICTLEAEGKDASKTIKYQFVKSDYDYNS